MERLKIHIFYTFILTYILCHNKDIILYYINFYSLIFIFSWCVYFIYKYKCIEYMNLLLY